ncbi:Hypothetical protein, putative [Bodo saltans]|uniref:Uncharacterized protein n=1 Tax=Bodo saltans TaxID=75058 RepID=A0A0S4JPV6_BODSA|nr:Hypothetical protein, putative [Bodo saltans]|eukprot:CUG91109.1 Hypothetical protein, putative [Bodo saltans]
MHRAAILKAPSNAVWRAAPLPLEFHLALETGDWQKALRSYQSHPFHAPPVDTFDLLKLVMHSTGVRMEDVKSRFSEKVKLASSLQRRVLDEVEWAKFWEALNQGDSKVISQALAGAKVHGIAQQIGVAEACAVLIKSSGQQWKDDIVESVPFGTVTRNNLVTVALERQRWDVAVELLRNIRLSKADVSSLWPLIATFEWQHALLIVSNCVKSAVPFETVLPHLLDDGCDLSMLSEHLERASVLGDVDVVAPLLAHAAKTEQWDYVDRAMDHLADIGTISDATFRAFQRMCSLHGTGAVCRRLQESDIPLHSVTMDVLEQLNL